ncbi:MAG: glycosyltransferase family 4 protein [Ferruginibacter sp.]
MAENKKKVGIIVQRYGLQVNGGAEVHARMIAEKLSARYDITVLTSRALDNHTWKPVLPAGKTTEGGIKVIRFDHPPKPDDKTIHKMNRRYRGRLLYQKFYRLIGEPRWYLRFFPHAKSHQGDGTHFLENLGPYTYDLLTYLKKHEGSYAAYIFLTYIYYPTAVGLPTVGHKSLLIPTMHDEPAAHLPVFRKLMEAPQRILFNTEAEKRFSEKIFNIGHVPQDIVAVGIDPIDDVIDPEVLKKYRIPGKYILYVGRIESHKGCEELIDYFTSFLKRNNEPLTLVLAGKNTIDAVKHPQIIYSGFISDVEKVQLIKQCEVLVIPSKYESLSLVLLEAFACKVPVMVNGLSEVLLDHLQECKGGWIYTDRDSFETALKEVMQNKDNKDKGLAGYSYVSKKYSWEKVLKSFDDAIEFVVSKNSCPG